MNQQTFNQLGKYYYVERNYFVLHKGVCVKFSNKLTTIILLQLFIMRVTFANNTDDINNILTMKDCNNRAYPIVEEYIYLNEIYLTNKSSAQNITINVENLLKIYTKYFDYLTTFINSHRNLPQDKRIMALLQLDSPDNEFLDYYNELSTVSMNFTTLLTSIIQKISNLNNLIDSVKTKCDQNGINNLINMSADLNLWQARLESINKFVALNLKTRSDMFSFAHAYSKALLTVEINQNQFEKLEETKRRLLDLINIDYIYQKVFDNYNAYTKDPNHFVFTKNEKCQWNRSLELLRKAKYEYSEIGKELADYKEKFDLKELEKQYNQFLLSFDNIEKNYFKYWESTLNCQNKKIEEIQASTSTLSQSTAHKCTSKINDYQLLQKTTIGQFMEADILFTEIYDSCFLPKKIINKTK